MPFWTTPSMPTTTLRPSKPIGDEEYVLVDRDPPNTTPTSTCSVADTGHAAAITGKPLQNLPGRRPPLSGEQRLEASILTIDAEF